MLQQTRDENMTSYSSFPPSSPGDEGSAGTSVKRKAFTEEEFVNRLKEKPEFGHRDTLCAGCYAAAQQRKQSNTLFPHFFSTLQLLLG